MEILQKRIKKDVAKLSEAFKKVLYEEDECFMKNMASKNLAGDDISKYRLWEWTQGVGLFGYWQLFLETEDPMYLNTIDKYYKERFEEGLPAKNINTTAPMLTLAYFVDYRLNQRYMDECLAWCEWIMNELPKTEEGGFQHITSDTLNDQELWDDTLFMTVLFLAKVGKMTGNAAYVEEAKYQFMLHIKYLSDKKTGLWYHGWTFGGNHNFVNAFWGRGNAWITMAIPEFIEVIGPEPSVHRYLVMALKRQIDSLVAYQTQEGMWTTLIDDPTSYPEASATAGIGYGILKSVRLGLVDASYGVAAIKALEPLMACIDHEGVVKQVSYGTAMGRDSLQFYKDIPLIPMPYGQAMTLLFLNESTKHIGRKQDEFCSAG